MKKELFAAALGVIMIVILSIVVMALLPGAAGKTPVPVQTQITVIPIAVDGEPTTRGWGLAGHIAVVGEYDGELVTAGKTLSGREEYYTLHTLIDTAIKRESPITLTGKWKSGVFEIAGIEVEGKGMMIQERSVNGTDK